MNTVDRLKLTELTERHRFGCSDARPVKALFHISFRTLALASPANFIHVQHSVPKSQQCLKRAVPRHPQINHPARFMDRFLKQSLQYLHKDFDTVLYPELALDKGETIQLTLLAKATDMPR
eukprot:s2496_g13.t1